VFAGGHPIQGRACQHVDVLDFWIAYPEAAHRAGGHCCLHSQGYCPAARGLDDGKLLHGFLHGQATGRRTQSAVAVEPAGDSVAAERDHATAIVVHLDDQRIKDAVELPGQFVGTTPRPELAQQGLGQRRKARDVGKQRRATHAVRHVLTCCHGVATVYGNIGLQYFHNSPLFAGGSRSTTIVIIPWLQGGMQ